MKLKRNHVTPFISLTFLAVGLSGVLMFFHVFDGYTEVAHEYLGVFFVVCAMFHIIINWKALKIHFNKGVFIPAALGVLTVSVVFVVSQILNPAVDTILLNRIIKAPINDAFRVLEVDYSKAAKRLEANGISFYNATTIEALWINNDADPEKVIDLIME